MRLTASKETGNRPLPPGEKLTGWVLGLQRLGENLMQFYGAKGLEKDRDREEVVTIGQTLSAVIEALESLNERTEQDFLEIGDSLAGFMASASGLSASLLGLAQAASGDQVALASGALTCVLSQFEEFETRNQVRRSRLASMRSGAEELKHTLSDLDGTAAAFQTLGILTRIEAVRLPCQGSSFTHLPDELKAMAQNVRIRVLRALEHAGELIAPIEEVATEIAEREAQQTRQIPGAISSARASLQTFHQSQEEARASAIRLGAQYGDIAGAFSTLIVSVQFHDLTRQKIEHVIEVMRRLQSRPESEGSQSPLWAVVALQSAQLSNAENEFAVSVATIAESLEMVASRIVSMTSESQILSGLANGEATSFLAQMEAGCSTLLTHLAECADAEMLTLRASLELVEKIGHTCGTIADIEAVEFQMRLLAINACVQAAQLGDAGNTLNALAMSMQEKAHEARLRSATLVALLQSMGETAKRLAGSDESNSPSEIEGGSSCFAGLSDAVAHLHTMSESTAVQISQLLTTGNVLCREISAARDGFTAGALFAETLQRAHGLLEPLTGNDHDPLRGEAKAALAVEVAAFATHYTMQSEFDVYENFVESVLGITLTRSNRHQGGEPLAGPAADVAIDVEFF